MNKAIVIGGNHHNTLGVVRSLGRRGIKPYVIITSSGSESFVLKSKYIEKGWIVNDTEAAYQLMLDTFSDEEEMPVLFACHDVISSVFDLHRDFLSEKFYVPGSTTQGLLSSLMDKKPMADLGAQMGFNIPAIVEVTSETDMSFIQKLSYPVITKPSASKDGSKSDITICNTPEDLESFLKKRKGRNFVVQHFIVKDYEYQLIGCSLNEGKEVIIPGVSKLIRPSKTSNTGFLHYTELDDSFNPAIEGGKKFIRHIKYSGLFSLEFLRDKDGKDFFMEMNFRNDGNTICVANSGVNLPYIWYQYCVGSAYKNEIQPIHEEYVMPEFDEVQLYYNGTLSYREWKNDMKQATSYMDYADDDLTPTDGWNRYNRMTRGIVLKKIIMKIIGR